MSDIINEIKLIDFARDFINAWYENKIVKESGKGTKALVIDFEDVMSYDSTMGMRFLENYEEFYEAFRVVVSGHRNASKNMDVCFTNLPKSSKVLIKNLRSVDFNKFVSIEGIVRKSTKVEPKISKITFECPTCANRVTMEQNERKLREPARCSCGRKGGFAIIQKHYTDVQRIELEEIPERIQDSFQASQKVHVFLKDHLTDTTFSKTTQPGNKVVVNGTLVELPRWLAKTDEKTTMTQMIMQANHIEILETSYEEVEITEEDIEKIKEMAEEPQIIERLRDSIAPSIHGHEKVKEAILLQQFGGVRKTRNDGTVSRGMWHILLVGDAAVGKSKLLEYMRHITPKARYAVGGATTRAGITAAIVKDEMSGTYALEAGALVLAHKGTLLLDEADKMSKEDSASLHEAMEAGHVTRTGAGINATLPSETSILAAANPKFGRFDAHALLAEQIEMPPTLLSRFDAIFPLRDVPDRERDTRIAAHIFDSHMKPKDLSVDIRPEMIRKYIAYAKNLKPKLTEEVKKDTLKFYVKLRSEARIDEEGTLKSMPITARQYEAIIRMAEASAKARLSDTVQLEDATRAKNIMWYFLSELGMSDEGIDVDKITMSVAASTRGKIKLVKRILRRLEGSMGKIIPIQSVVREAEESDINEHELEEIIERLKNMGEIYEPKRGYVGLIL